MTQDTIIPKVAAKIAAYILFLAEPIIDFLVNMVFQYFVVKLPKDKVSPIFTVKEVRNTVANGITTTITANIETNKVIGNLHLPRSTIFGLVDFPDTVMYCFLPMGTVEIYSIINANAIRKTANTVASVSPSWEPIYT
jgi:hypothetical protein